MARFVRNRKLRKRKNRWSLHNSSPKDKAYINALRILWRKPYQYQRNNEKSPNLTDLIEIESDSDSPMEDETQSFENSNEINVWKKSNIPITEDALQSLKGNGMINDEIVNSILKIFELRSPNVYYFNSYFYPTLFGSDHNEFNYEKVKTWIKQDLFEKKKLLFLFTKNLLVIGVLFTLILLTKPLLIWTRWVDIRSRMV